MEAHFQILAILVMTGVLVIGLGRWMMPRLGRGAELSNAGPPAGMWKRASSIEPHVRPPVNGIVLRQVAIHVARRHHAPLPKEPGKLWR